MEIFDGWQSDVPNLNSNDWFESIPVSINGPTDHF